MRSRYHTKNTAFTAFILVLIALYGSLPFTVSADDTTIISIDPLSQNVSTGETFTVDVYCVPGQPIKSFELKLSFDASLLQASSVTEGDIFDGYSTFFNAGIINNNMGTIVSIYDLIIGADKVSDPGTFITISFTAQSNSGTSTLNIYDAGVTDEGGYLSISVNDGNATILGSNSPPAFSDVTPNNQLGGTINITVNGRIGASETELRDIGNRLGDIINNRGNRVGNTRMFR